MLAKMRPADEREFSRVLAEATATNTPLELTGGASKREIGRPTNAAHSVSTKSLARHHALRVERDGDVGARRHAADADRGGAG